MKSLARWQRKLVTLSRLRPGSDGEAQGLTGEEWERLVGYAAVHANTSLVAVNALEEPSLPAELRARLRRYLNMGDLRGSVFWKDLCSLAARVGGDRIVVLKGMALARLFYPRPGLRDFKDLDLLVEPETLRGLAAALERLGYVEHGVHEGAHVFRHHMGGKGPSFEIEVHTQLINLMAYPYYRESLQLEPAQLLERSLPLEPDQPVLRCLDPVDMLIHAVVHAYYHHDFSGLKLYSDLDALLAHGVDLGELVGRARETGTSLVVGLALAVHGATVGAGRLEPRLVEALAPRGVRGWMLRSALPPLERIPFHGSRPAGHAAKILAAPRTRQAMGLAVKGVFPGREFLRAFYQDPEADGWTAGARYALDAVVRGVRRALR